MTVIPGASGAGRLSLGLTAKTGSESARSIGPILKNLKRGIKIMQTTTTTAKTTVTTANLKAAISRLKDVINPKSSIPILGCYHVETLPDGALLMRAGDLEASAQTVIPGNTDGGALALAVEAGALGKLAAALPGNGAEVTLSTPKDYDEILLESGGAEYRLAGFDPMDYPAAAPADSRTLAQTLLYAPDIKSAIGRALVAIPQRDPRAFLIGGLVEITPDGVWLTATSAKILYRGKVGRMLPDISPAAPVETVQAIIPLNLLKIVHRQIKGRNPAPIMLSILESDSSESGKVRAVQFKFADGTVYRQGAVRGTYPDYNRIIPQEFENEFTMDRAGLLATLAASKACWGEDHNGVKFTTGADSVYVAATENPSVGLFGKSLDAITGETPTGAEIAFNGAHLERILKPLDCKRVVCRFNKPKYPAVWKAADGGAGVDFYVAAPTRVTKE